MSLSTRIAGGDANAHGSPMLGVPLGQLVMSIVNEGTVVSATYGFELNPGPATIAVSTAAAHVHAALRVILPVVTLTESTETSPSKRVGERRVPPSLERCDHSAVCRDADRGGGLG